MLLIDLDPVIYACGFASQSSKHTLIVEDGEGNKSVEYTTELAAWKKQHPALTILDKETEIEPAPESTARMILSKTLEDLIGGEPFRAFLTGKGNFRDEIATIRPYKGNRSKTARPLHHGMLRDYALTQAGVEFVVGMEADDAISIHAHSGAWGGDYTVVSVDKDLDQIPGLHWNYTQEDGRYVVDDRRAEETFVRQWIMGDSTDNIQGVPGIGPKKAAALMRELHGRARQDIYEYVLSLYGGVACHETAQLVYLLRKPTELWEPSKWIAGIQ